MYFAFPKFQKIYLQNKLENYSTRPTARKDCPSKSYFVTSYIIWRKGVNLENGKVLGFSFAKMSLSLLEPIVREHKILG